MTAIPFAIENRAAPFDAVAECYDEAFTDSLIGRAQREAVWRRLDRCFHPGQRLLELNCGTGVDAVHLAERGIQVIACDAAPRMIEVARRRLKSSGQGGRVELRVLEIERIAELEDQGLFDGAFSNFAGLNCVADLTAVARQLGRLLAPGATALLCMAGRAVVWEMIWYLVQGKPTKALRRFRRGGTLGRIAEGVTIKVWYPPVSAMARIFAPEFRLRGWRGIGVTVPPSYLEPWAKRYPSALHALRRIDGVLSAWPVFRSLADHALLEFQRCPEW